MVGWRQFAALRIRQEGLWWLGCALALALEPVVVAQTYRSGYATPQARTSLQHASEANPGLTMLYGRPLDLTTTGGFVTWRIHASLLVLAAVASALVVILHLRGDEEEGRSELLRSTPVGTHADLAADAVVLATAATAVSALTSGALVLARLPWAGSIVMGLSLGVSLLVWGAIAAVVCQVFASARTVRMVVMSAVAASYLARGVSEASASGASRFLRWLTPLGVLDEVRPFVGDRWWMLLAVLASSCGGFVLAGLLLSRRDLGQGMVPDRPGRARGSLWLRSPWRLLARTNAPGTITWTVALILAGTLLGSIAPSISSILEDTPGDADIIRAMGGQNGIVDAYFSAVLPLLGLVGCLFSATIVAQAAASRASGIAEEVLSTPVSRTRWLGAHLTWAMVAPMPGVVLGGLGAAVVARTSGGESMPNILDVMAGALVILPAGWLLTALAALAWVLSDRLWLVWGAVVVPLVIAWLGPAMGLPHWVLELSPYEHLPRLHGGRLALSGILATTMVACGLSVSALAAYRYRDAA